MSMVIVRVITVFCLQALLLTDAFCAEPDKLRLFYGLSQPNNAEVKPSQSTLLSQTQKVSPVATTSMDNPPATLESRRRNTSYHYNGFISSVAGLSYFINGKRIIDDSSIELVSASQSRRSLRLRTNKGLVFSISIGETIFANANANTTHGQTPTKSNIESTGDAL